MAATIAAGLSRWMKCPHSDLRPSVVLIDELGFLPVDKTGADLLFQIISGRYERGSTIVTSNRVYKQ
jgi:DNA replication protein DnaC